MTVLNDVAPCFGVGQCPGELDAMRDLYIERQPRTVLEIGVWYGGTLREWLVNATLNATIVAVDPEHQNPNLYDGWRKPDTELIVLTGRSQDSDILEELESYAPFDWVYIDGDHTDAAVQADVENTRRLIAPGGLMLLHDIAAEGHPPTPPFEQFEALKAEGLNAWEIVEEPPDWYPKDSGHGIGVVEF